MSVLNEKHSPVRVLKRLPAEGNEVEISVQKTDGGARVYVRRVWPNYAERGYLFRWNVGNLDTLLPGDNQEIPEDLHTTVMCHVGPEEIVPLIWND